MQRVPLNSPAGLALALFLIGLFTVTFVPTSTPVDVTAQVASARQVKEKRGEEWRIQAVISSESTGGPEIGQRVEVQDSCLDQGHPDEKIRLRCSRTTWNLMTGSWGCARPGC